MQVPGSYELPLAARLLLAAGRVDAVIEHELAESEGANLGKFDIEGAW